MYENLIQYAEKQVNNGLSNFQLQWAIYISRNEIY